MAKKKNSKIVLRSQVSGDGLLHGHRADDIDSVRFTRRNKRELDILRRAEACYSALYNWRKDCQRNYRYVMGDQWGDEVNTANGCIKERDAIARQGNVPLTNNMLMKLLRALIGVWRKQDKLPSCSANDPDEQEIGDMLTVALQVVIKNNDKKELDAEGLMRYLITAWSEQKITWDYYDGRYDVCVNNVPNYDYVFWDPGMVDSRGRDLSIIGELHDMEFNDLCRYFCHSRADFVKLKAIYNYCGDKEWIGRFYSDELLDGGNRKHSADFYSPSDWRLCRVIEVWTKERKPGYLCQDYKQAVSDSLFFIPEEDKPIYDAINDARKAEIVQYNIDHPDDEPIDPNDAALIEMDWHMHEYWYVRYMSPAGDILDEHESDYEHGEHPYILKLYPFTNGEVHSFVKDLIDTQRYINRLLSVNDKLLLSSAKGVLLYPMSMIPEGTRPEDISNNWNKPTTVIYYDDLANPATQARPEQIANRMTHIGTTEMLQLQMQMMEEASGVNGALQGKPGFAGQSAALYAQQTQNASVSILDLLESYNSAMIRAAKKIVKVIQQYYTTDRMLLIGGNQEPVLYRSALAGNVDFDVTLYDGLDSPDMRRVSKELLATLLQAQAITPLQYVQLGDWPYKQRLVKAIQENMGLMQQGQPVKPLDDDLQQQLDADTDTVAMHNARRILQQYEPLNDQQAAERYEQYQQQQQQQQ